MCALPSKRFVWIIYVQLNETRGKTRNEHIHNTISAAWLPQRDDSLADWLTALTTPTRTGKDWSSEANAQFCVSCVTLDSNWNFVLISLCRSSFAPLSGDNKMVTGEWSLIINTNVSHIAAVGASMANAWVVQFIRWYVVDKVCLWQQVAGYPLSVRNKEERVRRKSRSINKHTNRISPHFFSSLQSSSNLTITTKYDRQRIRGHREKKSQCEWMKSRNKPISRGYEFFQRLLIYPHNCVDFWIDGTTKLRSFSWIRGKLLSNQAWVLSRLSKLCPRMLTCSIDAFKMDDLT